MIRARILKHKTGHSIVWSRPLRRAYPRVTERVAKSKNINKKK